MEKHVELAGIVADDRQLRIDPMHQQRAQEDAFGGDAYVSRASATAEGLRCSPAACADISHKGVRKSGCA